MCGVAGLLDFRQAPSAEVVGAMVRALHHRGPDGRGVRACGPAVLGHTRLAVIDPNAGAQPMGNEDASVWVSFNGEIYNHGELRRQLLALGHVFATHCDTEVLVHGYEAWGDALVERLDGQFAFALWDARRRRLLLARDRTGIRPLFLRRDGSRLGFASEVKALAAMPGWSPRLDPQVLAEVFTTWGPLAGHSPFEGVRSLEPGSCLAVDEHGERAWRYWDWSFPPRGEGGADLDAQACAQELLQRLQASVDQRLRADVPVGAYLSGGLDSAAVAALARRGGSRHLRTFSIRFDDPEFDEGEQQQQLVRELGCEHESWRCSDRDIAQAFAQAVWHAEAPMLRTAPVPLMLLARQVHAAGFKVVLTGEGADEVLGGYDLFKEARVRRFMARAPQSAWRASLLGRLYPYLAHSPTASAALARGFFRADPEQLGRPGYGHMTRWSTTQRCWQLFSPELRDALRGRDVVGDLARGLPAQFGAWGPLQQDQYIESTTLLSQYLLCTQGDRMAMAHAVEGRFPFLDHHLIEFAARLPARYKLMGLNEKWLLKRAMRGLLPESVLSRSKQPYRAPDSRCFFDHGAELDWVAELLSAESLKAAGYFDAAGVARLLAKCRAGRAIGFADNMAFVGVLSTMLLHRQFVLGRPPRSREDPGA
ncbi:MAG: asparagine synthase (glutamine-hydrolyzing) [Betaproteobacteria bacterium]|nr:asparagine synthase (glutamine-hydrolyzing) [Betaproteobacteria bacterium]MBU6513191.1 asparagine synthase (glutamine-hydrolyzing) [Betaproteobacteria bacterium]MDE2477601.1 asparagine synthase (glutamine-hydrolyzing) [Betaproteobacteria bacterium]